MSMCNPEGESTGSTGTEAWVHIPALPLTSKQHKTTFLGFKLLT